MSFMPRLLIPVADRLRIGPRARADDEEEVEDVSKIQELREARGWSRSELARQARMDPGDIGKIERGILRPYPGQTMKIAQALGVMAAEIANEVNGSGR